MTSALTSADLSKDNPRGENYIAFCLIGHTKESHDVLQEAYERVDVELPVTVKGLIEYSQDTIQWWFPDRDALEIVGYHKASSNPNENFYLEARYYHPALEADASYETLSGIFKEFHGWIALLGRKAGFYDTYIVGFSIDDRFVLPDSFIGNHSEWVAKDRVARLSAGEVLEKTRRQVNDLAILEIDIYSYAVVVLAENGSCTPVKIHCSYEDALGSLSDMSQEPATLGMRI